MVQAAYPVLKNIQNALKLIKEDTIQPLEFDSKPFRYYYSSKDHALSYLDAS